MMTYQLEKSAQAAMLEQDLKKDGQELLGMMQNFLERCFKQKAQVV